MTQFPTPPIHASKSVAGTVLQLHRDQLEVAMERAKTMLVCIKTKSVHTKGKTTIM